MCSSNRNDFVVSCDPFITCLWKICENGRELRLLGSFVENKDELCRVMGVAIFASKKENENEKEELILVVCKSDRTIKIYKITPKESTNNKINCELLKNFEKVHSTTILSLSSLSLPLSLSSLPLSPLLSNKLIFTSSADSQFSVWNLQTNLSLLFPPHYDNLFTPLRSFKSTSAAVNSIDTHFVGNNRILVACAGDDESIRLFFLFKKSTKN